MTICPSPDWDWCAAILTPSEANDATDFPLTLSAPSSKISFFTVTTVSEAVSLSTFTWIFTVAAAAPTSGVVT